MLERFLDWLTALPRRRLSVLALLSAVGDVFPTVTGRRRRGPGAFLAQRWELLGVALGLVCWASNTASAAGISWAVARGEALLRSGFRCANPSTGGGRRHRVAYARHGVWGIFASRFLPGFRAAVLSRLRASRGWRWRALPPAAAGVGPVVRPHRRGGVAAGLHFDGSGKSGPGERVFEAVAVVAALGLWWWLRRHHRRTTK